MKKTTKSTPKSKSGKVPLITTGGPSRGVAGVYESRIKDETTKKEWGCRERFDNSIHLMKKSRNPIMGEETPRDSAEFLIPFESANRSKFELDKTIKSSCDLHFTLTAKHEEEVKSPKNPAVLAMRSRHTNLGKEIDVLKKAIEFKKQLVSSNHQFF